MNQLIIWKTALQSILKNKRRSMLTMLGIVIGIASVITIVAIGNGFKADTIDKLTSQKQATNEKKINFSPYNTSDLNSDMESFTENDLAVIRQVEGVENVDFNDTNASGKNQGQLKFQSGEKNLSVNYEPVEKTNLNLLYGRQLDEQDEASLGKTVVIDEKVAEELFNDSQLALNKEFSYNDHLFTIVGVSKNTSGEIDYNNSESLVFFPKKTYEHYFGDMKSKDIINITIMSGHNPDDVVKNVVNVLKSQGTVKNIGTYAEYNVKSEVKSLGSLLDNLTMFISAVAAISLIIAGVGVMNMMYISVSERIKEIGIRRALGATGNDIKMQFLTEGIALTLIGGIIGYILGMLLAYLASLALPFSVHPDLLTVMLAIGISMFIGIVFSYFPAAAAAKKDLIDIMK